MHNRHRCGRCHCCCYCCCCCHGYDKVTMAFRLAAIHSVCGQTFQGSLFLLQDARELVLPMLIVIKYAIVFFAGVGCGGRRFRAASVVLRTSFKSLHISSYLRAPIHRMGVVTRMSRLLWSGFSCHAFTLRTGHSPRMEEDLHPGKDDALIQVRILFCVRTNQRTVHCYLFPIVFKELDGAPLCVRGMHIARVLQVALTRDDGVCFCMRVVSRGRSWLLFDSRWCSVYARRIT